MKVYLAGPMTGYPEHNVPAFHAAAARLRAAGYEVVSPAETDGECQEDRCWEDWMRRDLKLLTDCDGVACISGWELSRGATLETDVARELGMPLICAESFTPLGSDRRGYHRNRTAAQSLDRLLEEVNEWQAATFPRSTARSAALHLLKEATELAENPTDSEEMADVLMLVAAVAHRAGVDLRSAVRKKLLKNRRRRWGTPDADGVVEHVRDAEEAIHG